MNLWSGRKTASVLKLNSHPKITFVSERPFSAISLSLAIIGLQGMGSFISLGCAAASIARGVAASMQVALSIPGMLTVRPVVSSIYMSVFLLDPQGRL